MTEVRARFEPEPACVPSVRRFLHEALESLGSTEMEYEASMLVTELATNAVLHARTPFEVAVSFDDTCLRLAVADRSPKWPMLKSHNANATTGRGLSVVSAVASAWGVDGHADGKTVWAELRSGKGPSGRVSGEDSLSARRDNSAGARRDRGLGFPVGLGEGRACLHGSFHRFTSLGSFV